MLTEDKQEQRAELQADGLIVSLQLCRAHRAPMQPQETVLALENLGLEGDIHARPGSTRQVLLIDRETLDKLDVAIGAVKENITTQGLPFVKLRPGICLRVGEAVLELTKFCSPCERMDEIRMGLRGEFEGQRGLLARVLQGGEIRLGDSIRIL